MDKKTKAFVESAYSICGASDTLRAALEDPNIEVPSVDSKIPVMNKVPGGDPKRSPLVEHHDHSEHKQIL